MRAFVKDNMFLITNCFYILEQETHYNLFIDGSVYYLYKPLRLVNTFHKKWLSIHSACDNNQWRTDYHVFIQKSNTISVDIDSYIDIFLPKKHYDLLLKYINYEELNDE